jgi:hypothetical protein
LSFVHLNSNEIQRSWSRYLDPGHHSADSGWGRKDQERRNKRKKPFEMLVEEAAEAADLQNSPSFRTTLHLYQDRLNKRSEESWTFRPRKSRTRKLCRTHWH